MDSKTQTEPTSDDVTLKRRKLIGQRIRAARKWKGYNLETVSKMLTERGYSLSASQLSRIETGEAPANTDDLSELSNLLGMSWVDLFGPKRHPWYIVRKSTAEKRLREVERGERIIDRKDDAHEVLIDRKTYLYIPLDEHSDDYVLTKDAERDARLDEPRFQMYLFEIGHEDDDVIETGLDSHNGEEGIYVIQGELEFWFRQEDTGEIDKRTLKPGDCLRYSSALAHGYRATGKEKVAKALFVYSRVGVSPPLIETGKEKSNGDGGK